MWDHIYEALVEGMRRVLLSVASFLPGLIILFLSLLTATLLAWGLSSLAQKTLRAIKFDNRLETIGFSSWSDWSPGRSPTLFIAKAIWWTVVAFGLLVGLSGFASDLASQLVVEIFAYLPKVLVALLLFAFGNLLARFLARGVLIGAVNMQIQSANVLSLLVKWLVLVITVAMILDHLHIGGDIVKLGFAILFGGVVLALALVVGLGWKEIIPRIGSKSSSENPKESEDSLRHL